MSKIKTSKLSTDQIIRIAGAIRAKKVAFEGLSRKEKIMEKARIRRIKQGKLKFV